MPRVRSPKRGSRAFSPRKRARDIHGRIKYWPQAEGKPRLLGFAGYKAGMTHVFLIEDRNRAPDYGKELKNAATVLEAPPMLIVGIRSYEKTNDGLKAFAEVWMRDLPISVFRKVKTIGGSDFDRFLKLMEDEIERVVQIRVIAATQPNLAGVHKKKADLMEITIGGGTLSDQLDYSKGLIGNTMSVSDVFDNGESIDIIGVTKGKGFQGPVKRWGIRILQRKSRKTKRGVASIGPWSPRRVMFGVPRAGQMGYHNRVEHNKRILQIGSLTENITPKGGFKRYGEIKGDFLLLKGSVMGPPKRLIKLRKSTRKARYPSVAPQITFIESNFLK